MPDLPGVFSDLSFTRSRVVIEFSDGPFGKQSLDFGL